MTNTEQKRIEAICKVAHIDDISDLSDGYHTFKQLYYQRMMLFAVIVKQNRDKAWKSLRHEDGELCFGGGWFIVGIDTSKGSYTYHYEDNYFSLFDCVELERGKPWDGHTEKDVIRLLSLEQELCDETVSRKKVIDTIYHECSGERLDIDFAKVLLLQRAIKALPSVMPSAEPKIGHWITTRTFMHDGEFYCDKCKCESPNNEKWDYCPNCGVIMIKPQKRSEE